VEGSGVRGRKGGGTPELNGGPRFFRNGVRSRQANRAGRSEAAVRGRQEHPRGRMKRTKSTGARCRGGRHPRSGCLHRVIQSKKVIPSLAPTPASSSNFQSPSLPECASLAAPFPLLQRTVPNAQSHSVLAFVGIKPDGSFDACSAHHNYYTAVRPRSRASFFLSGWDLA